MSEKDDTVFSLFALAREFLLELRLHCKDTLHEEQLANLERYEREYLESIAS